MDREQAVKIIKECKEKSFKRTFYTLNEYYEAVDMAIKALEQQPCKDDTWSISEVAGALERHGLITREPCEDAISRQAAKANIVSVPIAPIFRDDDVVYRKVIFAEVIDALPSVSGAAAEKVGHWTGIDEEPHEVWECDHCGFVIDGSGCIDPYEYRDTYKYCPNCGARMEKEGE